MTQAPPAHAGTNGSGSTTIYTCPARAIVPRTDFHHRQDRTVRNVLGAVLAES